jgi:hypothetical protein
MEILLKGRFLDRGPLLDGSNSWFETDLRNRKIPGSAFKRNSPGKIGPDRKQFLFESILPLG